MDLTVKIHEFSLPPRRKNARSSGKVEPLQIRISEQARRALRVTAAFVVGLSIASGQSATPTSDPQALTLASRAIVAMTGGQVIHDVTLTGGVTWGSHGSDTGTVALSALGADESRVDLTLSKGTRTVIRDSSTGVARGKWVNSDGTSGATAAHNAMTDAVWFFPALGSLASVSNVVLSYIGQEMLNGESVQHLRSYLYQPQLPQDIAKLEQAWSAMDFYLDSATLLPVAERFNEHPDDNAAVDIRIEVDFSNYQNVSGVEVPMHIRQLSNDSPRLDITVTNAAFNTGTSMSNFTIN
jgi:hypothetical protein